MFLELVATFVAGIAGAGVMMLVTRLARGRLPRWLVPVAAGAAMIAATISNEYGWFPRTQANLPEGIEIAITVEDKALYRPWTYLKPFVSRFLAVDTASVQRNPQQPGQVIVDLLLFGRWAPLNKIQVAFDCPGGRRADLIDGVDFGADGAIENVDWISVGTDDPALEIACNKGA